MHVICSYKWTDSLAVKTPEECGKACLEAARCKYFTAMGGGWTLPGMGGKNCLLVDGGATLEARENKYEAYTGAGERCYGIPQCTDTLELYSCNSNIHHTLKIKRGCLQSPCALLRPRPRLRHKRLDMTLCQGTASTLTPIGGLPSGQSRLCNAAMLASINQCASCSPGSAVVSHMHLMATQTACWLVGGPRSKPPMSPSLPFLAQVR